MDTVQSCFLVKPYYLQERKIAQPTDIQVLFQKCLPGAGTINDVPCLFHDGSSKYRSSALYYHFIKIQRLDECKNTVSYVRFSCSTCSCVNHGESHWNVLRQFLCRWQTINALLPRHSHILRLHDREWCSQSVEAFGVRSSRGRQGKASIWKQLKTTCWKEAVQWVSSCSFLFSMEAAFLGLEEVHYKSLCFSPPGQNEAKEWV